MDHNIILSNVMVIDNATICTDNACRKFNVYLTIDIDSITIPSVKTNVKIW